MARASKTKAQLAEDNASLRARVAELESQARAGLDLTSSAAADSHVSARLYLLQARLAGVVATSQDAIVSFTPDWHIENMNQAAERLFGRTSAELRGQPATMLAPGVEQQSLAWINRAVQRGEAVPAFEMLVYDRDGQPLDVSVSVMPILDAAGGLTGIWASLDNITDRKRAEAELRASEERFRILADNSPYIIWVHDANGELVFVNKTYCEFFGITSEQVRGANWKPLVHPDDVEQYADAFAESMRTHKPFRAQARVRHADGTWHWVDSYAAPRFSPQGEFLGFVGSSPDITDRKRRESYDRFLSQLSEDFARTTDPRALVQAIGLRLSTLLDLEHCLVVEFDAAQARFAVDDVYHTGEPFSIATFALSEGVAPIAEKLRRGQTVVIDDIYTDPDVADYVVTRRESLPDVRSMVAVPIFRQAEWTGAWCLLTSAPRVWRAEDVDFIRTAVERTWMAVENARLYQLEVRSRQRAEVNAEHVSALLAVTTALSAALQPTEVYAVTLQSSIAALHASAGAMNVLKDDGQTVEIVEWRGYSDEIVHQMNTFPLTAPIPGAEVIRTGEPLWFTSREDFAARYPHLAGLRVQPEAHAIAIVPLRLDGHSLGALALSFAERRQFSPEDKHLLITLGGQCALALERARLHAEGQAWLATLERRVAERTEALLQSQSQLRQLSAHVERLREEERGRIAREVHDELGGSLTGLKMSLAQVRKGRRGDVALMAEVDDLAAQIDSAVQSVRRIASELRPPLLDDLGLLAAMEWQAEEFQKRTGITCRLSLPLEDPPLERARRIALFRVFQETLTNVARHAGATRVTASVDEDDGCVVLQVRDNGRGIEPDVLRAGTSMGLIGMEERIREVAGELRITSASGKGTAVWVRVPLDPPMATA